MGGVRHLMVMMMDRCSSPLANFGVLALSTEGFDLELDGALLQRQAESPTSHL